MSTNEKDGVRVHTTLIGVIQIISGLAGVAFLAAVGLLQLVFSQWGLNFAQYATPGDVIMVGADVFLRVGPFIILLAMGSIAGAYLKREAVFRPGRKWLAVAVLLLLCLALFWFTAPKPMGIWLLCFILGGIFAPTAPPREPPHSIEMKLLLAVGSPGGLLMGSTINLAACVILLHLVFMTALGFQSNSSTARVDPNPTDCQGRLLWAGERTVVVDCSSDRQRPDIVAVINPPTYSVRPSGQTLFEALFSEVEADEQPSPPPPSPVRSLADERADGPSPESADSTD